jgi:hypothetical protein
MNDQRPVPRVLNIKVNAGGKVDIKGDEFTVGELGQLGEQLIKIAQSQKIRFGEKNEPGQDKERAEE